MRPCQIDLCPFRRCHAVLVRGTSQFTGTTPPQSLKKVQQSLNKLQLVLCPAFIRLGDLDWPLTSISKRCRNQLFGEHFFVNSCRLHCNFGVCYHLKYYLQNKKNRRVWKLYILIIWIMNSKDRETDRQTDKRTAMVNVPIRGQTYKYASIRQTVLKIFVFDFWLFGSKMSCTKE